MVLKTCNLSYIDSYIDAIILMLQQGCNFVAIFNYFNLLSDNYIMMPVLPYSLN